jgi:hypothetical protein
MRGPAEPPPATYGKPPRERRSGYPYQEIRAFTTRIRRSRQPVQIETNGFLPGNLGTGGHRINEGIDYMLSRHLHPANITRPTIGKRSRVRIRTFLFIGRGAMQLRSAMLC